MRYHFFAAILISFLALAACKDKQKPAEEKLPVDNTLRITQNVADDSVQIRKVVFDFYNWYNKNYEKLMDFQLYKGIKQNDMPPYQLNWDEVKKYQDYIRTSVPQLGEAFLEDQTTFLKECESEFKIHPEDELPSGFDYDWYTNSQEEPQYLLDAMNKAAAFDVQVNGDTAFVKVYGESGQQDSSLILALKMKKEKGNWTIAKIGID